MTRDVQLFRAAQALQSFLWDNSGTSADWPVDIVCRDEETGKKLKELLQAHRDAVDQWVVTKPGPEACDG